MVSGFGQDNLEKVGLIAAVEGIDTYLRNIEQIARGQDRVQGEMEDTARTSDRASKRIEADWQRVGRNLAIIGGAITGAFAFGAKAAIDFESAMADVRKTVDEGEPGFLRLEEGVTRLSQQLPIAREEIARTVAAAGQLGIEGVDNLLAFTEVSLGLGISTDLAAQDAAFALAQLFNVTGDATDRIDEIGSVIVDLGNNTATTESRILDFAQRIAAGATNAGLATEEILGLSATVLSLGVNTERGATQISTAFARIALAIGEGGSELQEFANLSGLTADEFREAWREDAAGTFELLVQGLADAGDQATVFLDKIGLDGTRAVEVFQALARSEGQLTDNIELANAAATENVALAEEVARRNATAAAQIQRAWNEIKAAFADAGETLLPVLELVLDLLGPMLDAWNALPAPVQAAMATFVLLVGVLATLGGSFIFLRSQLAGTVSAMTAATVSVRAFGVAVNLSIPIIGVALAAVTALAAAFFALSDAQDAAVSRAAQSGRISELANTYEELGDSINIAVDRTGERLRVLADEEERQAAVNAGIAENIALTPDQFRAVGQLVDKGIEFADALELVVAGLEAQNSDGEAAAAAQRTYAAALARAAEEINLTEEQIDRLTQGYIENATAAVEVEEAAAETERETRALGAAAFDTSNDLARLTSRAFALQQALSIVRREIGLERQEFGEFGQLVAESISVDTLRTQETIRNLVEIEGRAEELADTWLKSAEEALGFEEALNRVASGASRITGAFDQAVEAIERARAQMALGVLLEELRAAGGNNEALALAVLLAEEARTSQDITSGIRKIAELFPGVRGVVSGVSQGDDLSAGVALLLSLLGGAQAGPSLPSFQTGGFVTGGRQGAPILAQLHVGEFVIPADRVAALLGPRAAETRPGGDVHFTANYFELEEPVRVRDDLEALRLAGVF